MSTPNGHVNKSLRVLTAVVENNPGVLSRMSGMVRRRGFNIQGLSVGPTADVRRSRMTLAVDAGHAEVDQVEKQLDRLVEVIEIQDLTEGAKLVREMALVKLAVSGEAREQVLAELSRIAGRVVDEGPAHVIVEVAGEFDEVERFLETLKPYRIVDLARSGPVAMSKEVRKDD
ncbi:MAG: acetolactate synthase small subunit [Candidatus Dormibacteraeota bacterium]|nr:acetolactate synthase small subunit [Candidatus Dormibacteraeota bacterium]